MCRITDGFWGFNIETIWAFFLRQHEEHGLHEVRDSNS